MPVRELHRQVAFVALTAAARYGFALAGGNALILHKISDRYTQDVDLFTDSGQQAVQEASAAVEAALAAAGFQAEKTPNDSAELIEIFGYEPPGLAEWTVTSAGGEQTLLQLSYFDRAWEPVVMDGIGPVVSVEDAVGRKISAWGTRAEVRDALDVAGAMERYGIPDLVGFARRLDPGLTGQDLADAARRVDHTADESFAAYGLTPADIARVRDRLAAWPRA